MLLQKYVYFTSKILIRKNLLEQLYAGKSITAGDKLATAHSKHCHESKKSARQELTSNRRSTTLLVRTR